MSDMHEVRRLRIRPGPGELAAAGARALTEVAHRLLAPELDEALRGLVADSVEVEIPTVRVRLDVDPREIDERTLAALWAGLIRAEVVHLLAASADASTTARAVDAGPVTGADPLEADAPGVRATDLAAVISGLLAGDAPGPADLRALAVRATDDAVTVEALALLPTTDRGAALELLRAADVAPSPALLRRLDVSGDPTSPTLDADDERRGEPRRGTGAASGVSSRDDDDEVARRDESVPREQLGDRARQPDTGPGLSSYGGLVLLHHRLRPFLERATTAVSHDDDVAVRLDVLAALVRPEPAADDPRPAREDPLVRLLAGDPGWLDQAAPPRSGAVVDRDDADDVLRSFAADLPGFAGSTPDFVRFHWIGRRALLVADDDAVLLRLAHRPLDLLLDRLPYPIGALRLPWTPTLLVGWEAA